MSFDRAARVLEWKAGKTPGPWRMFVFPTYRCNLKCGYCTKALVPDPPVLRNEIPDERLLRLVDESAELGVREWFIGGGGEPMLRRDVVMGMCEKIVGYGMRGILQTNATLFQDSDIETLVRLGWDYFSISIDGPDAETNDRIRWKKSFDKLVHAVDTINHYKAKYNRQNPSLNMAVVVSAMNYNRLEDLVELARQLKIRMVTFNELYVHHEGMDDFILSEEQQRELPDFAARAERKAEASDLFTNVPDFVKALGSVESRALPPPVPERADDISRLSESMCFDPWTSMSIVSSGNVGPCCVFWEEQSDNIKEMTLRDAWMGPYMTKIRRDMLGGAPPEACATCQSDFIRQNWAVSDALKSIEATSVTPTQLVRKAVATLQKNGVAGALSRGREWIQIRRNVRNAIPSDK